MALIGSILVKLGLQSAAFTKGLEEAKKKTKDHTADISLMFKSMVAFAASNEIKKMGKEMGRAVEDFSKGSISAAEFHDQLVFAVPVVGDIAEGLSGVAKTLEHIVRNWDGAIDRAKQLRTELKTWQKEKQGRDAMVDSAMGMVHTDYLAGLSPEAKKDQEALDKQGTYKKEISKMEEERKYLTAQMEKVKPQSIELYEKMAQELEVFDYAIRMLKEQKQKEWDRWKKEKSTAELSERVDSSLDFFFDGIDKAIEKEAENKSIRSNLDDFFGDMEKDAAKKLPTQYSAAKEQRFAFTYRAAKEGKDPLADYAKQQLEEQKKIAKSGDKTNELLAKQFFADATL